MTYVSHIAIRYLDLQRVQAGKLTSNANALVVDVATSPPRGGSDDGGTHSWGQTHVADVHVNGDPPLALHAVVSDLLRGIVG